MIVQILDGALRNLSQARELFLHHSGEDFDADWVADKFNRVVDEIEELKEIASLRKEEEDETA